MRVVRIVGRGSANVRSAAAAAARIGANSTASIHKAKAGRAAYVPSENLKGHNDPGAEAVALLFEGLAKAMED